ncbi:hypothetical protein CC78DRAFT_563925 [Lojkania enalia]|uniref:Uncharacterized protein n=1 Tax=Lojkania enalia TaxID=147567 RepID=A0A9P4NCL8_9PLEO|nr:hypothetical protein CC78DRAFT_563925 [Didymosphaeria enalia]
MSSRGHSRHPKSRFHENPPKPQPEDMPAFLKDPFGYKERKRRKEIRRGKMKVEGLEESLIPASSSNKNIRPVHGECSDEDDIGPLLPGLIREDIIEEEMKAREKAERYWWDRVMEKPVFIPTNNYAVAFPSHPYLHSEPTANDRDLGESLLAELQIGLSEQESNAYGTNKGHRRAVHPIQKSGSLEAYLLRSDSPTIIGLECSDFYKDPTPINGNSPESSAYFSTGTFSQTPTIVHPLPTLTIIPSELSQANPPNLHGPKKHRPLFSSEINQDRQSNALPLARSSSKALDSSMIIYRVEDGKKEIIPHKKKNSFVVPELAHLVNAEPMNRDPTSSALTWALALNQILHSDQLDPANLAEIEQRISEEKLDGGPEGERSTSTSDLNLVPNFSFPIPSSVFFDRGATQNTDNDSYPGLEELANGAVLEPLNGTKMPKPKHSDPYALPTGLPNDEEPRGHKLATSSHTPTPVPVETQNEQQESTINVQAHLIRKLHSIIDKLRLRNEDLEENRLPKMRALFSKQNEALSAQQEVLDELKDEIIDLKIAIDFSNKVIAGCWERDWEIWRFMKEVWERKKKVRGRPMAVSRILELLGAVRASKRPRDLEDRGLPKDYERNVFGKGPVPSSSRTVFSHPRANAENQGHSERCDAKSSGVAGQSRNQGFSKTEADAIMKVAAQNIRLLKEDVEEMVELIRGCKHRATGIQGIDKENQRKQEERVRNV